MIKTLILSVMIVTSFSFAAPGKKLFRDLQVEITKNLEAKGVKMSEGVLKPNESKILQDVIRKEVGTRFDENTILSASSDKVLAVSLIAFVKIQNMIHEVRRSEADKNSENSKKAQELETVLEAQNKLINELVSLENKSDKNTETLRKVVEILPKMSEWTLAELQSWSSVLFEVTAAGGNFGKKLEDVLKAKGLTLDDILKCRAA